MRPIVSVPLATSAPIALLLLFMLTALVSSQVGTASHAQEPDLLQAYDRCHALNDAKARLRCIQNAIPHTDRATPGKPDALHGWRLLRTPRPQGDGDAVSISHTAELLQSDPDFAGLMVRCTKNSKLQVLVVLIRPFPPRAHPTVRIRGGSDIATFEASIVPPGSAVLLPEEATRLAEGPWQSLKQLSIEVVDPSVTIRGVVPIVGLQPAMHTIQASCPS